MHDYSRYKAFGRAVALTALALSAIAATSQGVFAQEKTDVIVLTNGDQITGEIEGLKRGKLKFRTDAMGTVYIKWESIKHVNTDKEFEVGLESGLRISGTIMPADDIEDMKLLAENDTLEIVHDSLVFLRRTRDSFWQRFEGMFDLGVDFTQQSSATDISVGAELLYTVGVNDLMLTVDADLSYQDDAPPITGVVTRLIFIRPFSDRWFYAGFLGLEENSQLSLDLRGGIGGGIGRFLVKTHRVELALLGGAAYSREKFSGVGADNVGEAVIATDLEVFTTGGNPRDISVGLGVIPVFTQPGRFRFEFAGRYRRKLFDNIYLKLYLHESFDTRPPAAEANKNDLGLTTSVGVSF